MDFIWILFEQTKILQYNQGYLNIDQISIDIKAFVNFLDVIIMVMFFKTFPPLRDIYSDYLQMK